MFSCDAVLPRQMLPPPTTQAICTPLLATSLISCAIRYTASVSIGSPRPPPANASPLSLSRTRLYAGCAPARTALMSRLADVEPGEPADLDVLPEDADGAGHKVGDRAALVAHERLLEQHVFLVVLVDLAVVLDLELGFLRRRDVVARDEPRPRGADVQRQIVGQLLENLVLGDEIGLAGQLDQHAHLAALMDVVPDEPFAHLAIALLGRDLLAALREQLARPFSVA